MSLAYHVDIHTYIRMIVSFDFHYFTHIIKHTYKSTY